MLLEESLEGWNFHVNHHEVAWDTPSKHEGLKIDKWIWSWYWGAFRLNFWRFGSWKPFQTNQMMNDSNLNPWFLSARNFQKKTVDSNKKKLLKFCNRTHHGISRDLCVVIRLPGSCPWHHPTQPNQETGCHRRAVAQAMAAAPRHQLGNWFEKGKLQSLTHRPLEDIKTDPSTVSVRRGFCWNLCGEGLGYLYRVCGQNHWEVCFVGRVFFQCL